MYIPEWVLIIGIIILYWIYTNSRKNGVSQQPDSIEGIEGNVVFLKSRIFGLEHFDSPHFLDYQNASDVMEVNYFRLKQRFIHTPEKVLEIARDWKRYVEALGDLKYARLMLDVDWSDDIYDKTGERMKEPTIAKEEIEKKFKDLLGKDWQEIPPDYFKRIDTAKLKGKKKDEETPDYWKTFYMGELLKKNMTDMCRHSEIS
ncbi:hypothetical protein A3F57_03145 [Candidatus Roizmanbacteria bacterium RIFCSPHIGHO2_12_FULL_36_11]|uniref:Uncharacterized protein n=1 Tax=Candidatus Curtissbacteria bacterium RIFCSPLOWO2_01_FULL_37_9 TaxID=1797724 RepID=A0A1F5GUE9_9BACT|nr:MAG: hypothetical protein A3A48_03640 [Candidatus Curtissbacteria bacterium RIFCSPLOWO2_01_FULL_37_9]OGK32559.1 MAG: hypothetical protein A3F57_03145 [Candidatus Roizmanbacteria bacterium RIFCSPHIGHO2_12_FULL_36_11]